MTLFITLLRKAFIGSVFSLLGLVTHVPFTVAGDYKDIWWNASQSGMGFNLSQVGNTVFGAWYFYADSGRASIRTDFSGDVPTHTENAADLSHQTSSSKPTLPRQHLISVGVRNLDC
jgi:hypothetical protein